MSDSQQGLLVVGDTTVDLYPKCVVKKGPKFNDKGT